jgi:hypothetical protein
VTPEELDSKIHDLVAEGLRLEGGEMMMPLKQSEIDSLHHSIRDLVNEAAREVTR